MQPEIGNVYHDLKYNCDLVVEDVKNYAVLIKEVDSENNYLCGVEEFEAGKRFSEK